MWRVQGLLNRNSDRDHSWGRADPSTPCYVRDLFVAFSEGYFSMSASLYQERQGQQQRPTRHIRVFRSLSISGTVPSHNEIGLVADQDTSQNGRRS